MNRLASIWPVVITAGIRVGVEEVPTRPVVIVMSLIHCSSRCSVAEDPATVHRGHVSLENVQVGPADGDRVDPHDDVAVVGDLRVRYFFPGLIAGTVVDQGSHGRLHWLVKFQYQPRRQGRQGWAAAGFPDSASCPSRSPVPRRRPVQLIKGVSSGLAPPGRLVILSARRIEPAARRIEPAARLGGGPAERPLIVGPRPVAGAADPGQRRMRHPITWGYRPALPGDLRPSSAEREMTQYPADHAGLEILPFDRCLQLLTTVAVGRVSFFAEGEIVVLPVNHLMDGQDPVFRTARGSKLSAAEGRENVVAFEADDYDERTRCGWSVLVNGRANAIYEEAEIQRLNRLGLRPWVSATDRPFSIRIRPTTISGRRIPGPEAG